ncbi:ACP phosphodiesterase [Alkalilimnicola ehrlichii]|uniref:ACP phosphodiesterase n=1 Tax=Alkalilimnicola ehrlichii TaxID=351052 RepID=UPI003BA2D7EE
MNHLAHLQLSDGPDERLGNLLGDHVRGRLQPAFLTANGAASASCSTSATITF